MTVPTRIADGYCLPIYAPGVAPINGEINFYCTGEDVKFTINETVLESDLYLKKAGDKMDGTLSFGLHNDGSPQILFNNNASIQKSDVDFIRFDGDDTHDRRLILGSDTPGDVEVDLIGNNITNLADGVDNADAVNKGQLDTGISDALDTVESTYVKKAGDTVSGALHFDAINGDDTHTFDNNIQFRFPLNDGGNFRIRRNDESNILNVKPSTNNFYVDGIKFRVRSDSSNSNAKDVLVIDAHSDPVTASLKDLSGNPYVATSDEHILTLGAASDLFIGVNVTTSANPLNAGEDPTVEIINNELVFGIPKGDTGEKGDKGDTGDQGPAGNDGVNATEDYVYRNASHGGKLYIRYQAGNYFIGGSS